MIKTIAVAHDLSDTAIVGNDLIEDLKIYTKKWLDPQKTFSDLNGNQHRLLCKQKASQINNLNQVLEKVEDFFDRK